MEKYNYGEIERLFDRIEEIITYFEINKIEDKSDYLFISSGERLPYKVTKDSLPHLLGINMEELRLSKIYTGNSSYDILKIMIDKGPYFFNEKCKNNYISFDKIFSDYTFEKIDSIIQNIKITTYETLFVAKYESENSYTIAANTQKFDYIVVKEYSDGRIGVLGLVYNERANTYIPMSNQIYANIEEASETLKKYLYHQEISILNAIHHKTYQNYDSKVSKIYLGLEEKRKLLRKIQSYKNTFNYHINVTNDFEFSLNKTSEHYDTSFEETEIIYFIAETIKKGKFIGKTIPEDCKLKLIADAFNDYISTHDCVSETAQMTYTNLKKLLEETRESRNKYIESTERLEEENEILTNKISELEEENAEYKKINDEIYELVLKRKK